MKIRLKQSGTPAKPHPSKKYRRASETNAGAVERFLNEARAAAALNHPNICTIHDIGEHSGRHFIAMKLLEGETLKQRIKRQQLEISDLLDTAIEITDAIAAAHAAGRGDPE